MTTFEITFVHGDQKTKVEVKSEDKGDALNTAIHQVYGEKAYFAESNGTGGKIRKFGQIFRRAHRKGTFGADPSITGNMYIDIYEM
ncbi:hypothetical protein SMQE13_30560 [Serratia marcescens]|nr:hypothetical protein SMQE13_30560 [Serratia marcescens]